MRLVGRCAALVTLATLATMVAASGAGAQPLPAQAIVDRVAVRYYAPETGGSSHPLFVTERMLAFEARLEAMAEGNGGAAAYQERYVRAALERHIAEEMLAALMIATGTEPPDLPKLAAEQRVALGERIGGPAALTSAAEAEGIADDEISAMLRRRVRAAHYLDRSGSPVLHVGDDQLREVFRTSAHPFKGQTYDEARAPLTRWFLGERLRVAEIAFLQAARARVTIAVLAK